jgi:hypothetical protein
MQRQVNHHLLTRLEGIRQSLMAHHLGGSMMPSATRGSERESFVREFLEKLFPPTFRFGTGAITDSVGACSGQIDVVIEYPFLPSFPMPGASDRLYLAESVALALEVKSDLAAQWSQVENSVKKLRPVKRRWQQLTSSRGGGISFAAPTESDVPFIAVGYKGYSTLDALKQRLADTPAECRPNGALVVDSGVFIGRAVRRTVRSVCSDFQWR